MRRPSWRPWRFEVERHDRAFRPDDLDGVHLVISATNDPEANGFVAAHARSLGLWVNAVDDAAACDALFPSILRRGLVVAAISTEGAFAGLSRVVREALEGLVPDATIPEFEALVQLRQQLQGDPSRSPPAGRVPPWHSLADPAGNPPPQGLQPMTSNPIEALKAASNHLRGNLAQEVADPDPSFSKDGQVLVKFHGFYQQKDRFEKTAPPVLMLRGRIPGGRLAPTSTWHGTISRTVTAMAPCASPPGRASSCTGSSKVR